ncbi:MAG: hypothetical protein Q4C45_02735 [Oscillospiraceae bacterium]|nr:hypothetical protein [Oscillospiraceae bacterium]
MGRKSVAQQIREVLSVGDTVYLTDGGPIREAAKAVLKDRVLTSEGELLYGSHQKSWWLTSWGAEHAPCLK